MQPEPAGDASPSLVDRMLRAARLDAGVYEEVENDPSTLRDALLVVVISALAAGLGSLSSAGLWGLVVGTIGALIGWYVWAYVIYWIGTRVLPGPNTEADHGELLRVLGFAQAPGVIRVLGVVPGFFGLANAVASIWMIVTTVVAVRQALDYESTGRAVGVCLIGFLFYVLVGAILIALFGAF